jgi:hypothetical protein
MFQLPTVAPGVAIMTCTPRMTAYICGPLGTPP